MRSPALVLIGLTACASQSRTVATTNPADQCPGSVQVTVSNPGTLSYDVYYYSGSTPRSMLGEVSPGSTVTFPLPGEGRGSVRLERRKGDIAPGNGATLARPVSETRIRTHC